MYGDKFKKATESLMSYCQEQLQYGEQPDVHYVTDSNNANNLLGNTAYYQPDNKTITVFISSRHPKDALRSLAHELVHHAQNVRGDLANSQTPEGYAQKDPHMRKMEEEAYLKGNMMFRDWEDACKSSKTLRLNLPTTLGEQKMTNLKDLIKEKIIGILSEEAKPDFPDVDGDGDRKEPISKAQKDKKEKEGGKKKKSKDMSKVPPQLRKHVAKKVEEGESIEEKSLGSSPGKSIDKFVEKGVIPTVKAIGKGAARTAGAGVGATIGALKGAGKGAKDGYDFVKDKLGLEETEELEEGGAAQRQGNEDRLRRQEPDRIKEEETLEEGKCPHCDGDAPKSECKCGSVNEESELVNIKKSQNSINSLNETRLLNVNKELMRRLLK